jgi:hypothetical protein
MPVPKDPEKYKQYIEKLRNIKKGHYVSEETKKKISDKRKGNSLTAEHRLALSIAARHRPPMSDETHRKMSIASRSRKHTEETKEKMRIYHKNRSEETKRKLSDSLKRHFSETRWYGSVTYRDTQYCFKFKMVKEQVRAFFGYCCVECGTPQYLLKRKLSVHHVDYDKSVLCNGKLRYFVPLCNECHTPTNYNREEWMEKYIFWIETYYGGKCFLEKDEMKKLLL